MSHWHKGKTKLKCSISVLRAILVGIKKEWKDHIQVDEKGGLTGKSGYSQPDVNGVSVKIPMGQETGVNGADLCFNMGSDGVWEINYDYLPRELNGSKGAAGRIEQELSTLKKRASLRKNKVQIVTDQRSGSTHILEAIVPVVGGRLSLPTSM